MTGAEILLDRFDALIDTPEAVERLRRFVLDLAVRGKLVAQDPSDEPAEALLQRIAEEKRQRHEAGEIRKPKRYKPVKTDDEPYSLPDGWAWTRLGTLRHGWGQTTPAQSFSYIDVSAIDKERGVIGEEVETVEAADAPSRARKLVRPGTVLYSTVRPNLLNVAIVDREFDPSPIASTAFAIVHPFEGVESRYLFYFLRSRPMIDYVESKMVGLAYPAISDGKLYPAPVPLPPTNEQRRIVARVDELMALCDRLADGLARRDALRQRWAASTVQHVTEDAPIAGAPAWSFAEAHFDTLLAAPEAVPLVRRMVLDLAISGRLTEQDFTDEPAEMLLRRVLEEQRRMYEADEIRKPKRLKPVGEGERPFQLPKGWAWTRVAEVGHVQLGRQRSPKNHQGPHMRPYLRVANVYEARIDTSDVKEMNFDPSDFEQYRLKPGDLLLNEGQSAELVGRPAIYNGEVPGACFQNTLVRVQPYAPLESDYFLTVFRAYMHDGTFTAASQQTTNIAHLGAGRLAKLPFPLPPLSEQSRIVARVGSLLELIDRLARELRQARIAAERMLTAAISDGSEAKRNLALPSP